MGSAVIHISEMMLVGNGVVKTFYVDLILICGIALFTAP
jgi:hypothetical protein